MIKKKKLYNLQNKTKLKINLDEGLNLGFEEGNYKNLNLDTRIITYFIKWLEL